MPFVFWAIALTHTLFGIEFIKMGPEGSFVELFGYILVGLGMRFMASAGKASR